MVQHSNRRVQIGVGDFLPNRDALGAVFDHDAPALDAFESREHCATSKPLDYRRATRPYRIDARRDDRARLAHQATLSDSVSAGSVSAGCGRAATLRDAFCIEEEIRRLPSAFTMAIVRIAAGISARITRGAAATRSSSSNCFGTWRRSQMIPTASSIFSR